MADIAIVTDSTAYIPNELVKKYGIHVCPQVLIWGEQTFEDGVDILPNEFYARLSEASVMPSTSQVTPASFLKTFGELAAQGSQILNILISDKLSGTIPSAIQARGEFPDTKIEIVNSGTIAMALGFSVLAAARAAEGGASLEECKALAEKASENTGVVFAVDTLEFLHRGGRIGGANRFIGTALNIKPILEVRGGQVEAIERVRTRKKSIQRLLDITEERIAGRKPLHLAVMHANALDDAKVLLEAVKARFEAEEYLLSELSPVVGTHAGPGTLGVCFMAGM